MKIFILHLSDLHFKVTENSFLSKVNNLTDAIKNKLIDNKFLFILISGDLAYSGKREEYLIVKEMLDKIEKNLISYNRDMVVEFVFAPGNHDCDFNDSDEIRNILIDTVIKEPSKCSVDVVRSCTKVQKNYLEFTNNYNSINMISSSLTNELLTRYEYQLGEYKVLFNSYNTAWMSRKNEKQSQLIFPNELLEIDKILEDNSGIRISFFHHPYHWLEHKNIREFKNLLHESSDIIFTGHEHTPSATKTTDYYKDMNVINIEAGTIQDSHDSKESKFNLLTIELGTGKKKLFVYEWNKNDFEKILEEELNQRALTTTKFNFKSEYAEKLNSLGIKTNHPRKDNIKLEDLFVFPHIKQLSLHTNISKQFPKISSEKLLNDEIGLNILYGEDNSGKTILSYVYQKKLKELNYLPININCTDFKNKVQKEDIVKVIRSTFKRQFKTSDSIFREYDKYDRNKVVLILEDFHKSNGNNEYKMSIVDQILNLKYSKIIIFANDSLRFEATSETPLSKILEVFNHYTILEFGHKLRDELITKWIKLGQETDIELADLANIRREKAKQMTQTVGFNIVPSYPLYLLTLLHAMEINDTSLDKSSFGHYYNFLILQYLNNNGSKLENKDINTIYFYCAELSFKMFISKKYNYSYSELMEYNSKYLVDKDFFPDYDILEKLIKSTIILKHDDTFKFTHKYIYYYFVAYYFSKNIDKSEITSIIEAMTKRLYRTEFSNILMFILHLSPQTDIINVLKDEAKKIFSEYEEFTFHKDELKKINSCIKEDIDTSIKLENRTLQESREIEIEKEERQNAINKSIYFDDRDIADHNEEIQQLDFYKRLNLAFKLMEIIGEIVKNYSGTLEGPTKSELIKLVYGIGLRSLKTFISLFEEHHEQLVSDIKHIIVKKNKVTADKINETVYGTIFGLASSISTEIVKKISKSIAAKDLKHIYKRFSEDNEDNLAYKIIKIASNLDFAGGMEKKEILKLHDHIKHDKNMLPNSALKNLVLEHLYMFEISYSKRASICSELEIDVSSSQKKLIQNII